MEKRLVVAVGGRGEQEESECGYKRRERRKFFYFTWHTIVQFIFCTIGIYYIHHFKSNSCNIRTEPLKICILKPLPPVWQNLEVIQIEWSHKGGALIQ